MPATYDRDLIGCGANPPNPKWPGGARLAINFVMNYAEGSEPSVQDRECFTEVGLTEAHSLGQGVKGRDLAGEGMFEYGSRVGFWRLMRLLQERKLPMTVFGCALALERHKPAADAIRASGFDVCCHGWRWLKHYELTEAEEREHIRKAVASLQTTVGERPLGWYCRYGPSVNTWRLIVGEGVLEEGRTPAAPDRALLAHQQRRQVRGLGRHLRRVVRFHPRRLRHALQGGRQDAENDVGRAAHAADRAPGTRGRPGAAARLHFEAGRSLGNAAARYCPALDDDAPFIRARGSTSSCCAKCCSEVADGFGDRLDHRYVDFAAQRFRHTPEWPAANDDGLRAMLCYGLLGQDLQSALEFNG